MPKLPVPTRDECLRLAYLFGGMVVYRPGEWLGPRTLHDWELVLIIEGTVTYTCGLTTWTAPPGTVILGQPGSRERYEWDPVRATRHAYFHFGISTVPRDWPPITRWPVVLTDPDPVMPALFRRILQECVVHPRWPAQSPSRDVCRMVEAMIAAMLQENLRQRRSALVARPEPVQRCLQWMRQRIDDDPSQSVCLADLASAANLSSKHLCRLFNQSMKRSPMSAFRLLRLQAAVVLLSRSNMTIKQVAARCGFQSPFHFSRCFTKVFGQSPRDTRRRIQRGQSPPAALLPPDLMPRVWW